MKFHTKAPHKNSSKDAFAKAELHWDLERLYKNLSAIKGGNLSPMEKHYLRGLLCGYSPREIANKLHRSSRGLEAFLSSTVYQYIKSLTGNQKMRNYRDISEWLANLDYKLPELTPSQKPENGLPLETIINIDHGILYFDSEKNTVNIDIHINIEGILPKTPKDE